MWLPSNALQPDFPFPFLFLFPFLFFLPRKRFAFFPFPFRLRCFLPVFLFCESCAALLAIFTGDDTGADGAAGGATGGAAADFSTDRAGGPPFVFFFPFPFSLRCFLFPLLDCFRTGGTAGLAAGPTGRSFGAAAGAAAASGDEGAASADALAFFFFPFPFFWSFPFPSGFFFADLSAFACFSEFWSFSLLFFAFSFPIRKIFESR